MASGFRPGAAIAMALALAGCGQSGTDAAAAAERGPTAQLAQAQNGAGRQARGLPRGATHVERAVILDPSGFEAPLAAATLFLPAGWRSEGGVFWGAEFMCTNGYNFVWSASAPDGAMTIAIMPQMKWEQNNYGAGASSPGCQSAPYTNVRQYLEGAVQQFRPGAQVLDFRARPDLAQEFASLNSQTPTAMGEMRTWVEAGEILVAYADNGRDMRGTVAAAVVFNLMRTNPGSGMAVMDALTGFAFPGYAAAAPNGQLNFALAEAIRKSIKVNPQWQARIGKHNTAIGRVAIDEARKRAAMITQSNAEISRIREEAWSAYQDSSDRRAREFGELIKGVETYRDADAPGGQVELSANYNHAWRLNDGSYVITDDASFEPYRDVGLEGRRLDAVQ